jgi:hypothetical protein
LNTTGQFTRWLGVVTLLTIGICSGCSQQAVFVEDRADLLSAAEKARITRICGKLFDDLNIHIMTVVLDSPAADIDAEAVAVFADQRVGEKTGGARGVLFLVDPFGSRVRLEIGYDLEGIFTDAFAGTIERSQMVPFFQAGRVGHGIEATVELLVGRAMGDSSIPTAAAGQTPLAHLSGGGGARTNVQIGSGPPAKKPAPAAESFGAQPTPMQTLERYMQALAGHVKDPDLGIYTEDTRAFFRKWLVTDAQQDNERKTLERGRHAAQTIISGQRAVIRFPAVDRRASPYFLRRGKQGWMLDFAAMSGIIGFNHKNQWFFRSTDHRFMFGFADLVFDRHGFPHPRKN